MLAIGGISMAMFLAFRGTAGISHVAFFLWGLAFGPLMTMYQTAVSKQVEEAKKTWPLRCSPASSTSPS